MGTVVIVDKVSLQILSQYVAEAPSQSSYGGPWGDPAQTVHILVPAGTDPNCVDVQYSGGVYSFVPNHTKIDAKTAQEWLDLRAQRDILLAECDWTQLPDSPLTAQDKTTWATYRQTLRDLPANTPDPASPTWPAVPSLPGN